MALKYYGNYDNIECCADAHTSEGKQQRTVPVIEMEDSRGKVEFIGGLSELLEYVKTSGWKVSIAPDSVKKDCQRALSMLK